ncbi:hypothetical protein LCGC14_2698800 [marine sediment metagenome]|uniref:Uncharacterized protein n=1 Tax=marine sediment metagenome TaxID=412755 RepID=A0A0F9A3Y5_9ZZZZ
MESLMCLSRGSMMGSRDFSACAVVDGWSRTYGVPLSALKLPSHPYISNLTCQTSGHLSGHRGQIFSKIVVACAARVCYVLGGTKLMLHFPLRGSRLVVGSQPGTPIQFDERYRNDDKAAKA